MKKNGKKLIITCFCLICLFDEACVDLGTADTQDASTMIKVTTMADVQFY